MRFVAWVERWNLRCAKLGNPAVYDLSAFPWAREIEAGFPAIRAELEPVKKFYAEAQAGPKTASPRSRFRSKE